MDLRVFMEAEYTNDKAENVDLAHVLRGIARVFPYPPRVISLLTAGVAEPVNPYAI
jgi:hypothetical protein